MIKTGRLLSSFNCIFGSLSSNAQARDLGHAERRLVFIYLRPLAMSHSVFDVPGEGCHNRLRVVFDGSPTPQSGLVHTISSSVSIEQLPIVPAYLALKLCSRSIRSRTSSSRMSSVTYSRTISSLCCFHSSLVGNWVFLAGAIASCSSTWIGTLSMSEDNQSMILWSSVIVKAESA